MFLLASELLSTRLIPGHSSANLRGAEKTTGTPYLLAVIGGSAIRALSRVGCGGYSTHATRTHVRQTCLF